MFSRRRFLSGVAAAGAVALSPIEWLMRRELVPDSVAAQAEMELYGDFLLIRKGLELPPVIQQSRYGPPVMCLVGAPEIHPELLAQYRHMDDVQELAEALPFRPFAAGDLVSTPYGTDCETIEDRAGNLWQASITHFDAREAGARRPVYIIRAWPDFVHPFPLRWTPSLEEGHPEITLHKVTGLPSPGVMRITQRAHYFFWTYEDVLYQAEDMMSRDTAAARDRVSSLRTI